MTSTQGFRWSKPFGIGQLGTVWYLGFTIPSGFPRDMEETKLLGNQKGGELNGFS